jgi:hypothetical protein
VFTLAGRAEELIRDIRTPLNKGDTKTFILDITGIASDSLRLEFPAFSTTTPLYTFKVGGIESYEVTITGATLPFMLDGSGAKQLSIIVTR